MKKTLAVLLALITICSTALVACNNDKEDPSQNTEGDDGFDISVPTDTDDTTGTGEGTDTTDTNNNSSNNNGSSAGEFTSVTKSVYTMARVYLRSEPKRSDSSKYKIVEPGTKLDVTATNTDWYKVTYEGAVRYIVAAYVTDNIEDTQFSDVAEDDALKTLTIAIGADNESKSVNLREVPVVFDDVSIVTVDNTKVTAEKPLTILKKNASGNWFVVEYNDKEYYVAINSSTKPCFNEFAEANDGPVGG